MPVSLTPLFPGMLFDAAARFAQDNADTPPAGDPVRDMGWACTLVPEARGGVGGTLEDLAPVVEGLALHGMQLPVIEMCAVAPLLLQAAPVGTTDWLQAVCEGSATVAPLTPLAAPLDELPLRARLVEDGWALQGEALGVASAPHATHWVAPARTDTDGAVTLFVISREQMPSPTMHYRSMESRQAADFRLDLTLPATACIAHGEAARSALNKAGQAAIVLTTVDTVAALAALIGQTVQHLNERHQFGVALSSFQALRHRLADMYVRYQATRGLLIHVLAEAQRDAPDLARTLDLAKLSLAESARTCAESAIQMHGGMGMSEEVLATRLAQRLLTSEFRYGDRLLMAARLLRPPPVARSSP